MPIELSVQILVLGATAVLFWFARRDLAARVLPPMPVSVGIEDLEQLCATLEALVTDLSQRLTALEDREPVLAKEPSSELCAVLPEAGMVGEKGAPDPQYAPVYALMESGVTDAGEIVRQTGLSRGEVDLIISLRSRQIL